MLKKLSQSKSKLNPKRDWAVLVVIFFALVVFVLAFHLYFFMKVSREEMFPVSQDASSQIEIINRGRLKEIIDYFDKKERHFREILEKEYEIIDPSL